MCRAPDLSGERLGLKERIPGITIDQKYPSLAEVKRWFPKEVFELSTAKSFVYWARDAAGMLLTMGAIVALCRSEAFVALPFLVQCLALMPIQFAGGFFMWCMFVVGHDCGHTTFSPHQPVNELMGELSHSVLLCTPFDPWRRSHHRHHSFHNHMKEDYSHMWYTQSQSKKVLKLPHMAVHHAIRVATPFLNWFMYLYLGQPDGGHLVLYGRLWKGASLMEYARGYLSSAVALCAMYGWWALLGENVVRAYCMPWVWYGWWLFTVTFFQHHFPEMLVFREGAWSYVRGAFETIDRTYGLGIDDLHHNITDGHVAHHLFFTKIPHFHLSKATKAMREGLAKNNLTHLYKHEPTPRFALDIHTFLHQHYFWVQDNKVVDKCL